MMAVFAISLVFNEPEDNTQMQHQRGQKEFSRHLRIAYPQGTAFRATNGLLQNCWRGLTQDFQGQVVKRLTNLDAEGGLGRTKKQKQLKRPVVISPRIHPLVPQKRLQRSAGWQIIKQGHGDPGGSHACFFAGKMPTALSPLPAGIRQFAIAKNGVVAPCNSVGRRTGQYPAEFFWQAAS